MKILLVSHNVFSKTTNMGKTLESYFADLDNADIAQFYIHSEIPTDNVCTNYYRVTDQDMIRSILTRKSGKIYKKDDIQCDVQDPRSYTEYTAKIYQRAKSKSPLIYIARNTWWNLGKWKTKKLLSWVDEFDPDVVFFASGDYAFMYKVALELAQYKKIPLVISCMDDYYLYNKNENKLFGKTVHRSFMKQVCKTMKYASCIFPICEKMGRDYKPLFNKPYYVLHTPSIISSPLIYEKENRISYVGNLGYKRNEQIIKIGQALKKLDVEGKPDYIDVYSTETRPEILSGLTEENGIKFHGGISADEVIEVMGKSRALIHVESFEEAERKIVAYSVSTKIADSLASGTPIFAFGPSDVASIEYLVENDAAVCALFEDELVTKLYDVLCNNDIRNSVAANALLLKNKNHAFQMCCARIRDTLGKVCEQ